MVFTADELNRPAHSYSLHPALAHIATGDSTPTRRLSVKTPRNIVKLRQEKEARMQRIAELEARQASLVSPVSPLVPQAWPVAALEMATRSPWHTLPHTVEPIQTQKPSTFASQFSTAAELPDNAMAGSKTKPRSTKADVATHVQTYERWEKLSARWEGLTAYWMKKLESNQGLVESPPSTTAMTRQISDLASAGANLFHAVVELQRLRASAERKFQRWFVDMRQEQDTMRQQHAALNLRLQAEQAARANDQSIVTRMQHDHDLAEQRLSEMTRELFISRQEARRAWEELGRRELEERNRDTSLRHGQPTLVGGVQVVPYYPSPSPEREQSIDAEQRVPYLARSQSYTDAGSDNMAARYDDHIMRDASPGQRSLHSGQYLPIRPVTRGNPIADSDRLLVPLVELPN